MITSRPCVSVALALGSLLPLLGCDGERARQAAMPATTASTPRLDVVLVLIDTLRPDHLDVYGYAKATAPFLNSLAPESAVFRRAFSTSSWTAPSTASVFTGLYPPHHGLIQGFRAHSRSMRSAQEAGVTPVITMTALPEEVATLPELFRQAGYVTFGAAANINVDERVGFARGFDRFHHDVGADAEALRAKALEWKPELEAAERSFLYLHFNDVHRPYQGREPWYEPDPVFLKDRISQYDSEISYVDSILKQLYEQLAWDRDTILMVISDHGEEFREHGRIGHHFTLHQEVNGILFMLHAPGTKVAPRVVECPVSLIDVLPTLVELAGIPGFEARDGRSLVPLLDPGAREEAEAAFAERTLFAHRADLEDEEAHLWAAIRGPWRLIEDPTSRSSGLFDFHSDPRESRDRARAEPRVAQLLRQELQRFREPGIRRPDHDVSIPLDDELMRQLEQLGYVGGAHDDEEEGEKPDRPRGK